MIQNGVIILAGAVGLWFVLNVARTKHQHRKLVALSDSRSSGFSEYCEQFPGVPQALLQQTYELVQKLIGVPGFRILASDELCGNLCLDQGQLESEVEDVFGVVVVTVKPLITVADLVTILAAQQTIPADRPKTGSG
jgi:hypothetical protein